MKLKSLKKEANEACKWRGHKMIWEKPFHHKWSNSNLQDAKCKVCGMEVQCCDNPRPNGIDIGGEAVALNCVDPIQAKDDADFRHKPVEKKEVGHGKD